MMIEEDALNLYTKRGFVEIYSEVLEDWFALARSPWAASKVRNGIVTYLPREITAIKEAGIPRLESLRVLHWAKGIFGGEILDKKRIAQEKREAETKKNRKTRRPWRKRAA